MGETLTAGTTDISDGDGLGNAVFAYQWLADDSNISGATDSTYTLVAADAGKTIKVRVSFTDDAGNNEELTSVATGAVAPKPNTPATGAPTISGTARVSETLTASTTDISDADGMTSATFTYQWLAGDAEIKRRHGFHLHSCCRRRGQDHQGKGFPSPTTAKTARSWPAPQRAQWRRKSLTRR